MTLELIGKIGSTYVQGNPEVKEEGFGVLATIKSSKTTFLGLFSSNYVDFLHKSLSLKNKYMYIKNFQRIVDRF